MCTVVWGIGVLPQGSGSNASVFCFFNAPNIYIVLLFIRFKLEVGNTGYWSSSTETTDSRSIYMYLFRTHYLFILNSVFTFSWHTIVLSPWPEDMHGRSSPGEIPRSSLGLEHHHNWQPVDKKYIYMYMFRIRYLFNTNNVFVFGHIFTLSYYFIIIIVVYYYLHCMLAFFDLG